MKFRWLLTVSFRKSEKTLYAELLKAHPRFKLDESEVVAFLSQGKDQLVWCYGYLILDDGSVVLRTRKLRLLKGEWDVLRLKEYAAKTNLKIDDWSVFDKALKQTHKRLLASVKKAATKTLKKQGKRHLHLAA